MCDCYKSWSLSKLIYSAVCLRRRLCPGLACYKSWSLSKLIYSTVCLRRRLCPGLACYKSWSLSKLIYSAVCLRRRLCPGLACYKSWSLSKLIYSAVCLRRRLCPGLAFFQSPTSHTLDVLNDAAGTYETLRVRVERSVLKSQNVSRSRLGFTTANVTTVVRLSCLTLGSGHRLRASEMTFICLILKLCPKYKIDRNKNITQNTNKTQNA